MFGLLVQAEQLKGVVAANFSYVFQLYGRVTSINREDMRGFKKAWAESDTQRTGYLKRRQLSAFFAVSFALRANPR